jgi:hypothetical protein
MCFTVIHPHDLLLLFCVQVVRLCREHGLYGALIYLFNQGLNDFRTPLEELLSVIQSVARKDATATWYVIFLPVRVVLNLPMTTLLIDETMLHIMFSCC